MSQKSFKTIEEQLEILSSRGLKIEDKDMVKTFLLHNNYYRVSGYSLTLRKNDVFFKSVTFQNIIDIYNFDNEFRHIILQYIEKIEVSIKSIYAYEFSRAYGPLGYLDSNLFSNKKKYAEIINKANSQLTQRLNHEAFLKHYVNELSQDLPLWAYVDLLTISDISFLYSISDNKVKDAIAHNFNLYSNKGSEILGNYMHSMTIIRNLCAHGSRLYNRLFERKPSLNKSEKALLIIKNDQIDNSRFYGFFLIMRRLLTKEDFKDMKTKIIDLNKKYPFVKMEYYGFRNDWQSKL